MCWQYDQLKQNLSFNIVQLALKAGVFYDKVSNVTIWGNHSTTQVITQILL